MKKICTILTLGIILSVGCFNAVFAEEVANKVETPTVNNPELPFIEKDKRHGLMRLAGLLEERSLAKGQVALVTPLKIVPSKSKLNRYSLIVDSNLYKLNGTWVIDLVEPKPENMSIDKAKEKSKNYQYWFNYYDTNDKCLYTCWAKYCPCNKDKWPQWIAEGKK